MELIDIKKLKTFLASKVTMMTDYDNGICGSLIDEYIDEFIAGQQTDIQCEDAVSRETLVNFIKNASVWVTYKKGDSEDEAEFAENIIKQTKQAIISMIELDLPSAQPQRTGHWIKITNTLYKCDRCGAVQLKGNCCKDCEAKMMEGDVE